MLSLFICTTKCAIVKSLFICTDNLVVYNYSVTNFSSCRCLKLTRHQSEMASTYLHNCRRPRSPIKFVKEISMQCTQHLNHYQRVRFPEYKHHLCDACIYDCMFYCMWISPRRFNMNSLIL